MSKEQCVNKKLHPYYKAGIYGWFGEEVDDNDYIICPICGEVLGMNYWDYAGEQGYDNKCPKCKQELDYSEIYDFEDTCYFEQLLEIKENKLNDLEAKLAESEYLLNIKDGELNNVHKLWQNKIDEVKQLKQQLADTEVQNKRVLEKLDIIVRSNQELEKQLTQKDKQLEKLKSENHALISDNAYQEADMFEFNSRIEQLQKQLAEKEHTINTLIEDHKASQEWYKKQLEEKETRIAELEDKDWYEATIKQLEEQNERLIKERDNANDQNKRVLEKLELIVRSNQELERKLADYEHDLDEAFKLDDIYAEKLRERHEDYEKMKIEFAVEQLEKVKELVEEKGAISSPFGNLKIQASDVSVIIDNQIKALKEGK